MKHEETLIQPQIACCFLTKLTELKFRIKRNQELSIVYSITYGNAITYTACHRKSGGIGIQRSFFLSSKLFYLFFYDLESMEFSLPRFAKQFLLRSVAQKNHNIERL